jgi:hypothetical protein
VFGKKRKAAPEDIPADLFVPRPEKQKAPDPETDELKELVGEALRSARADAE